MIIREDDLQGPEIAQLLDRHLAFMNDHSPPESVHALDIDGLRVPEVTFWAVWEGNELCGCGALKELSAKHGEIKSMHTIEAFRGRGVAERILSHVIDIAMSRSYQHLSLETGTMEVFAPARALYAKYGFRPCPPFGEYSIDPLSIYMTRKI